MANVDEYLAHIGYTGSKEPTVANLAALHSSQLQAVVFENISCIIGEKIKLDPDWIFEKIVKRGRGGELFIYFSIWRHSKSLVHSPWRHSTKYLGPFCMETQ